MIILILVVASLPFLVGVFGSTVDNAINKGTFTEPPDACELAENDVPTVMSDYKRGEGSKGGSEGQYAQCEWRGVALLAGIPGAGTSGDFSRLSVHLTMYHGNFVTSAEEEARDDLVKKAKPSGFEGRDGKQESIPNNPADEMKLVSNVSAIENDKPIYNSVLWIRVDNLVAEIEFHPDIDKPGTIFSRPRAEQLLSKRGVLMVGGRVAPKMVQMAKREQEK